MRLSVEACDITKAKCGLLVVNEFEGVVKPGGATGAADKALGGLISKLSSSKEISGRLNTSAMIHSQGKIPADHILVVGLGKSKDFGLNEARIASATAIKEAKKIKAKKVVSIVHGAGIGGLSAKDACRALVEGALIADYEFKGYKTDRKEDDDFQIEELVIADNDSRKIKTFKGVLDQTRIICRAVNKARDLVNMPSNKLTPKIFADTAKRIADEHKIKCTVFGPKEIQKEGLEAFWAIAKGSLEEPRFVILEYYNSGKAGKKPLGLIGKGITFDSGGISLKTPKNMGDMKTDMAGAAAVLCAMEAIAELKIKKDVIAILPLTENMPDGGALKPGDVIGSLSGKTIEIISTDAEGRMILADAISLAKNRGADRIIDLATLTGACIAALGDVAAGILGNDQSFIKEIIAAGAASGEKLWQMPLYDEYGEYLKSTVADIKNCSDLGKAGTSTGAIFLKEFIKDTPWAHIDIAGTAYLDRDLGYYKKGASGAGVFTILNYLLKL